MTLVIVTSCIAIRCFHTFMFSYSDLPVWPSSPNRVAQSGLVDTLSASRPGTVDTTQVSSDCQSLHPVLGGPSMPGLKDAPSLRTWLFVNVFTESLHLCSYLSYGETLLHASLCIRDTAPFSSLSSLVLAWSHWRDLLTTASIILILIIIFVWNKIIP